ncbi:unnamed protein product [Prorocentrum cordatum]|uniref:Secreted protein n=1 Tax=Prorocentrum cordatum TaxID=2364126 RepID=A0ABN9R707_9DINO|nr:unnamed protein product [Polarella glacialis]
MPSLNSNCLAALLFVASYAALVPGLLLPLVLVESISGVQRSQSTLEAQPDFHVHHILCPALSPRSHTRLGAHVSALEGGARPSQRYEDISSHVRSRGPASVSRGEAGVVL